MNFELTLTQKKEIASSIYQFWFKNSGQNVEFRAGQFLKWRLNHSNPDNRGIDRFFTIASSPTEDGILLATKIFDKSSTFKKSLKNLEIGDKIMAEGPYGEFTLSEEEMGRDIFIAGGIGITPFRSIIKYLLDTKKRRDIFQIYGVKSADEIVFEDIFEAGESELGIKTIYEIGHIDKKIITKHIREISGFSFYLSGPEKMVDITADILISLGAEQAKIKRDYFPGY